MISVRQEFLLKSIRRSSNGMTVEELCEKLQVSQRTFRDDMKQLQNFLMKYGVNIHYNSNNGYYFILQKDKNIIQNIIIENENLYDWIPKEANEREFYILFELLWNSDYLVTEKLAASMYISKAAVAKDIKKVSKWIKEVIGETLEISKGKGIRLITTEKNKRKMISSAIYRYYETDCKYLMKIFRHYEIDEDSTKYQQLNEAFYNFFGQRKIVLDQESFLTLILEIMVYLTRIKNNFFIEDYTNKYLLKEDLEYLPFNEFEKIFQVTLIDKEKNSLIDIYKNKNFLTMELQTISNPIEFIFMQFKNKIKEEYQIDILLDNVELIYRWKREISLMIYRNELTYHPDPSLANKIIKEYSESYDMVKCMGDIVEKQANIQMTKMDYAYQALYLEAAISSNFQKVRIAIASNNPYIIVEDMKSRIKNIFGDKVSVIYAYSVAQLPQLKNEEEKPDLILATHLVKYKLDIPIIFVSSFLKDDIDKITKFIKAFKR